MDGEERLRCEVERVRQGQADAAISYIEGEDATGCH